jgi:hypothetical protein
MYFLYFKVHGRVLFWTFLLKMLECYFIRVFEISWWKNSVQTLVCENYSRTENMCRIFFSAEHVFGLLFSPDICLKQHFFGVTNLRYVLFKADFFVPCCTFFTNFLRSFIVREPVQALYLASR